MAFKMNSPLPMFGDPGKIGKNKNKEKEENVLDAINKVSMQSKKFTPRSKETTVKKETSKNSRANIKARKEADKAAGVSKSQMRANKAKSKSEAALEKAKKSKNPSYKAQLKRKADRLAARAKRKGGSPVKVVGDPKDPKDPKNAKRKADRLAAKDPKRTYGKTTVKRDKDEYGFNRITVSQPYTTSTGGKKTGKSYKQLEKEGGDVEAAKKYNAGKSGTRTWSLSYGNAKPKGVQISAKTPKPEIDLKTKPKKGGSGVKTTIVPGKKKKQPKITKAKVKGNRRPSGLGRVKGCN
jgi:hypothetical protein